MRRSLVIQTSCSLFSPVSDRLYSQFQGPRFPARVPRYSLISFAPFSVTSYLSVIRVFGVFTRAQLHHESFWDNLSQQLQRRGQEYIERCTFRNKPLSTGDKAILPAQFPPLEYQVTPSAPFVKVSERDMKDVSEIAGVFRTQ